MAIASNLGAFVGGSRLVGLRPIDGGDGGDGFPFPVPPRPPVVRPVPPFTPLPTIPPVVVQPPPIIPPITLPPIQPVPPPVFQHQTTTALAQGAIALLSSADPVIVNEAINVLKNRSLGNEDITDYLERKVRIGEVLAQRARDWSPQTRTDFADAFQMGQDRVDTMDNIVSVAILNDRDLEGEIRAENTPQTTPNDVLQNRRVVWQHPPPGTVLTPPYVVLIAVEYQNVAQAEDVVRSILGQLGPFQGFKLPQAVIQRL